MPRIVKAGMPVDLGIRITRSGKPLPEAPKVLAAAAGPAMNFDSFINGNPCFVKDLPAKAAAAGLPVKDSHARADVLARYRGSRRFPVKKRHRL